METRELMITNYFVNILKRFYNENESFKELIDGGLDDYADFYQIDGIFCELSYGSSRVCLSFNYTGSGKYDGLLESYVVKIAREVFTDSRSFENERQNRNEYRNYLEIKEKGLAEFFTETIEGPTYEEVFGFSTSQDSRIYIAERADIDTDRYFDYIYNYVESNLEDFRYELEDYYLNEGESLDNDYTRNEAIRWMLDDYSNEDKYIIVLKENGIKVTPELEEYIDNIRDCHEENIGWIGDRVVMVDYGWHTTDGSNSYDGDNEYSR